MPALFNEGFFVRVPAWHGMGVVLDDYPSREEAMALAGHDWDVLTRPIFHEVPRPAEEGGPWVPFAAIEGYQEHYRSDTGANLHVARGSYQAIPNALAYEVAEVLFDEGFQYETGITVDGGKACAITLKLDEPFVVDGDDSIILPYGCLSWRHDGLGALRARTGTIRQVCANTINASEAEGARLGTTFTFRHSKNVKERIAEAKESMRGIRRDIGVYQAMAQELGAMQVTPTQRDLFVSEIIGDPAYSVSKGVSASPRVKANIEAERAKVLGLFMQDPAKTTIPEAHALTGYGLMLAGVEYFDHLRNYRTANTYVQRTLLVDSPAKAALGRTIRELVAA